MVETYRHSKSLFAKLALIFLALTSMQASASESSMEGYLPYVSNYSRAGFHILVREGFTGNGDRIYGIPLPEGKEREVGIGGTQQTGMGTRYQLDVIPLSLALSINYHYHTDGNENNDAAFRCVPLEAMLYFEIPGSLRLGRGVRYVHSARATATINGVTERITFKNTRGNVVEIGYQVIPHLWVDFRYVRETYQVESYSSSGNPNPAIWGNAPYNNSHTGLFFTFEN